MLAALQMSVLSNQPPAATLRACILTQSVPVSYDNSNSHYFPYMSLTG